MNTLAAFIRLAPRSCTLRGSAFLSPRACIFNLLGQRAGRHAQGNSLMPMFRKDEGPTAPTVSPSSETRSAPTEQTS